MKQIFEEYGGMLLAAVGTTAVVGLFSRAMNASGIIAAFVARWIESGC